MIWKTTRHLGYLGLVSVANSCCMCVAWGVLIATFRISHFRVSYWSRIQCVKGWNILTSSLYLQGKVELMQVLPVMLIIPRSSKPEWVTVIMSHYCFIVFITIHINSITEVVTLSYLFVFYLMQAPVSRSTVSQPGFLVSLKSNHSLTTPFFCMHLFRTKWLIFFISWCLWYSWFVRTVGLNTWLPFLYAAKTWAKTCDNTLNQCPMLTVRKRLGNITTGLQLLFL